ncbi:MAG: hypothetical protein HZY76_04340 [Anaerolineae bacterium]|nr:MAG: hypothetical protein HZY76_04340 [Anaerolineae bacterium]
MVIILLSDQREALLPTIASRCQVIGLRPCQRGSSNRPW